LACAEAAAEEAPQNVPFLTQLKAGTAKVKARALAEAGRANEMVCGAAPPHPLA
jgi:hypothetical protein